MKWVTFVDADTGQVSSVADGWFMHGSTPTISNPTRQGGDSRWDIFTGWTPVIGAITAPSRFEAGWNVTRTDVIVTFELNLQSSGSTSTGSGTRTVEVPSGSTVIEPVISDVSAPSGIRWRPDYWVVTPGGERFQFGIDIVYQNITLTAVWPLIAPTRAPISLFE